MTQITDREKQAIVALRNSGVTSEVIAKSFGLTRQQVAAYKAREVMQGGTPCREIKCQSTNAQLQ